jgi:hypothetical protein
MTVVELNARFLPNLRKTQQSRDLELASAEASLEHPPVSQEDLPLGKAEIESNCPLERLLHSLQFPEGFLP